MFAERLKGLLEKAHAGQSDESWKPAMDYLAAHASDLLRCVELLQEYDDDRQKYAGSHRGGFQTDVHCALAALEKGEQ